MAKEQDWAEVQAVLDYRNAKYAVELFNQGRKGIEEMQRQPALAELLRELHRAQGASASTEAIYADMQSRGEESQER